MKHSWMLALTVAWAAALPAEMPAGRTILTAVDRNMGSDTKVSTARMVIEGRRGTRTVAFKSWIRGMDESFTEYLEPPREKGVKMLKLGDQLWAYYPTTDRTIKISGHMLRQSVMGSDLSYEDLMEDPLLSNIYEPEVTGEEVVLDRPCWVLHLTATRDNLAYDSRTLWVDKERFVILREHRFAKSGKLLKTTDVSNVVEQDGRWIAQTVDFRDALKNGSGTRFILDTITFNEEIPEYVFSKAALRK
jgi:outer membrane lipoprotein-sorting protein